MGLPSKPPAPPNDAFCGGCGAPQRPIDRTCRRCGTLTTLGEHEQQHGKPYDWTLPPPAVRASRSAPGRQRLVGLAVVVLIGVTAAVLRSGGTANERNLVGNIYLNDDRATGTTSSCQPGSGFTNIAPGAPVIVPDATDATVAVGSITDGSANPGGCTFLF